MPTRYLKPGIRDSEAIDSVSALAETLFYRLLVTVDDFGRCDARPAMVKASCFPIKRSVDDDKCARLLSELASVGLIVLYESDCKRYLQVQKWDNTPRAKESKFPPPDSVCIQVHADARNPRTLLPVTVTETGTGTETENRKPETATENRSSDAPSRKRSGRAAPETAAVWEGYAQAYRERYGVDPVRNSKVNGQLSRLVARLGHDEAPGVARAYLANRNGLYVAAKHCVDLLLRDAEKLRTEWATGKVTHQRDARESDRLASTSGMAERLIAQLEAKGIK